MTRLTDVLAVAAPSPEGGARRLLRWLCTSNPFYVLSAGLFLAGLRLSFAAQTEEVETWALMAGLSCYTLLLAVTAFLLVRFCKVWDDARTVLLLVVLLFLATSMTFDELLVLDRARGFTCFLGGLLFAIGVSEGLLHGIGLRLPLCYRLPYYLILALFFLYPLALTPWLHDLQRPPPLDDEPRETQLMWGIFAFSSVAGLVFLTLLPAIRLGPKSLRNLLARNENEPSQLPWRWPWYPWALFVILGCVVPARAFTLCLSLHTVDLDNFQNLIFGPYFLVPFGLAVAVLLLEAGLVSRRRSVLGVALAFPVVLIGLALVGHHEDPIYQRFLGLFADRLGGDPLYLTLFATAAFYGYATLRRAPLAAEVLTAVLLLLAFVRPDVLSLGCLSSPQAGPILAAGLLQIVLGHFGGSSWRCLAGSAGLVAGAALVLPKPLVFHLAVLVLLVIGAWYEDRLGRWLRNAGAVLFLLACVRALFLPHPGGEQLPPWAIDGYPLALACFLAGYGQLLGHRLSVGIAAVVLTCWLGEAGWVGYSQLRQSLKGLDYLTLSLGLFVVAILVSLTKAGLLSLPRLFRKRSVSRDAELWGA